MRARFPRSFRRCPSAVCCCTVIPGWLLPPPSGAPAGPPHWLNRYPPRCESRSPLSPLYSYFYSTFYTFLLDFFSAPATFFSLSPPPLLVATLDGRFAELFLAQTQRGPFERTHSDCVGFVFRGEVRTCSSLLGTDRRTLSPLFDEYFNFTCPVLMAGWGGREVEEEGGDHARAKGSAFSFIFLCVGFAAC